MKIINKIHLLQIFVFLNSEKNSATVIKTNRIIDLNHDDVITEDNTHTTAFNYDPWRYFNQDTDEDPLNDKKIELNKVTLKPKGPIQEIKTDILNRDQTISSLEDIKDRVYMPWQFLSKFDRKVSIKFKPKKDNCTNSNESRKGCRKTKLNKQPNYPGKKRFLEVLQIVKFDHVTCETSSGLDGTCLHEYECKSLGGTGTTSCADGHGVCCTILISCDSQTAPDVAWFTNPEYPLPSTGRLLCSIAIDKHSDDTEQIRLDFKSFELLPPNNGACKSDQFIISGQNLNNMIPVLCGINTGQHVYIDVNESEGPIHISIQTEEPDNRLFAIKITQLTSTDDLIAPRGCLQYHNQQTGIIESFNYRDYSEIAINRAPSYLNNLNYAVCIERKPRTCRMSYTKAGTMQIVNFDGDGRPITVSGEAGVEIFNCPHDWLLIAATRLCGERLNDGSVLQDFSKDAPIMDDTAGPIIIWFKSDEAYVGRGFKIKYEQMQCSRTPLK